MKGTTHLHRKGHNVEKTTRLSNCGTQPEKTGTVCKLSNLRIRSEENLCASPASDRGKAELVTLRIRETLGSDNLKIAQSQNFWECQVVAMQYYTDDYDSR